MHGKRGVSGDVPTGLANRLVNEFPGRRPELMSFCAFGAQALERRSRDLAPCLSPQPVLTPPIPGRRPFRCPPDPGIRD